MIDKKAIADARRFFRLSVNQMWGYLIRNRRKAQVRTAREKTIQKARGIHWRGVRDAWAIYTEGNRMEKQAREAREKAISQAYELYLSDESDRYDCKLFVKAARQAYDDYAEAVAQVWKAFVKDMKRKY